MDPSEKGMADKMTPWIPKKKDWLGKRAESSYPKAERIEKVYSVAEVARLFSIDKKTVFKWMAFEAEDQGEAVIPAEAWFKLPNGHIRIREWIVLKLLNPAQ